MQNVSQQLIVWRGMARKAWELSPSDCFQLLKITVAIFVIRIALRLLRFRTISCLFPRMAASEAGIRQDPQELAYLVGLASRYHILNPTCLEKALILYGLLRRRGIEAHLRIGTMLNEAGLQAHAWIECQDRVILGGATQGYVPMCSFNTLDPERFA